MSVRRAMSLASTVLLLGLPGRLHAQTPRPARPCPVGTVLDSVLGRALTARSAHDTARLQVLTTGHEPAAALGYFTLVGSRRLGAVTPTPQPGTWFVADTAWRSFIADLDYHHTSHRVPFQVRFERRAGDWRVAQVALLPRDSVYMTP